MEGFEEYPLDPQAGVYALFWNADLLYIGRSAHVPARILSHVKQGKIRFNRVMVRWCEPQDCVKLEFQMIALHKPRLNQRDKAGNSLEALTNVDLSNLKPRLGAYRP